jgi:hypothetical protein
MFKALFEPESQLKLSERSVKAGQLALNWKLSTGGSFRMLSRLIASCQHVEFKNNFFGIDGEYSKQIALT